MKTAAMLALSFLLAGCAQQSFKPGMTTTLSPGQTMLVRAQGTSPVVKVANRGPGSITVSVEGRAGSVVKLGAPGIAEVPAKGPVSVKNGSDEKADVDVTVTGADRTDIHGPAVTGK